MAESEITIKLDGGGEPELSMESEIDPIPPQNQGGSASALPLWKREHGSLLQLVEIEEQSRRIAVAALEDLKAKISKYLDDIPGASKQIAKIVATLSKQRQCRVTAGVVGPTGSGKSTLLNAVMEIRDLLPTDNAQACTSAIIEVLWNASNDPSALFQAKINFLEKDEWRKELEQFYQDLEALDRKDDGEDDGIDLELKQRVDGALEKVKTVYPSIKTKRDVQEMALDILLNHENVRNLGEVLTFEASDRKKFSSMVRPFIVSSSARQGSAPWPLVKVAKLYVKAEILKDGLVLVDIPGSMDTNAARNTLAQAYQSQLSVNCILSRATRASSDQFAQVCLSETYQRNLQLDGQWKAENIIFIVVKTDESISVEDDIERNPAVKERLKRVFEKEHAWKEKKLSLDYEISKLHSSRFKNNELRSKITSTLRPLYKYMNAFPGYDAISPAIKSKGGPRLLESVLALPGLSEDQTSTVRNFTKLREDRINAKKQSEADCCSLVVKQNEVMKIEGYLSRVKCVKTRACINYRNEVQTRKIQKLFETISQETGNVACTEPLPVFCVSSSKYLDFVDNREASLGFSQRSHTHIPELQKRLVSTTLNVRHRNAKATLADIELLVQSINFWAHTIDPSYRLSPTIREELDDVFERASNEMQERFFELHMKTSEAVQKAIRQQIYLRVPETEMRATLTAPDAVDTWASGIHWSTYRAIVVKSGSFQSSTRKEPYSWNDDLAGIYWKPLIPSWTRIFEQTIPEIRLQNYFAAKDLLKYFCDNVVKSAGDICPQLQKPLESLFQDTIEQMDSVLQEHYNMVFDTMIPLIRSSTHKLITPNILRCMTKGYGKAAKEIGKGSVKRMQLVLHNFIKIRGPSMFKSSSSTLLNALARMVTELKENLDTGPNVVSVQAHREFQFLLDNHTTIPDPDVEKALSASKSRLQKDISAVLNHLMQSWEQNIDIPKEEEEEPMLDYDVVELDSSQHAGEAEYADMDDDMDGNSDGSVDVQMMTA